MIECSICKANNEERSLYCVECGQRLIPKVPDAQTTANVLPAADAQPINLTKSGRLHSPMLDMGEPSINRKNKPSNKTFDFDEDDSDSANNLPSHSISRNGLHSPLLDGQNHIVAQSHISQSHLSQNHVDKSRLHSPVLDGSISTSFNSSYTETNYVEQEEYESLRSPLLQAKVPLPEKNISLEPKGRENTLQSLLSPTISPSAKAAPNNSNNIVQPNIGEQKENFVAPLSITGINKINDSNNIAKSKRERASEINPFLPKDEKISAITDVKSKYALNKMVLISLIFLALVFKIWYLLSLGSAAFGSAPFIFDQGGQIMVLLLIIVIILS